MVVKQYPEFITVTANDWLPVLSRDIDKRIILDSLQFLVSAQRIKVNAFVLMDTHFHLIWQVLGDHKREDVQRDFLRFTSQQILKQLRNEKSELLPKLEVNAKDRKYQVWQRNSLGIELRSAKVFLQKLEYIHHNPVKASLCKLPEDYQYSSARFYELNINDWDFLTHYEG
ncbi:MAG TPA: transposase [Cyclobacteriaceae bacterium]|nr:transposase [Cyclobacteriaceae bacterium]HRF35306.1 transposase [Cyclobacteriaceae bacterium]